MDGVMATSDDAISYKYTSAHGILTVHLAADP